jgi:hypothetical protein
MLSIQANGWIVTAITFIDTPWCEYAMLGAPRICCRKHCLQPSVHIKVTLAAALSEPGSLEL